VVVLDSVLGAQANEDGGLYVQPQLAVSGLAVRGGGLAWLPLRFALSVYYIICVCVCMCVYISLIECVGYIEWKSEWASAGGRHLPLFQCCKGSTCYVIFSPF
jgi:hypothetical protein